MQSGRSAAPVVAIAGATGAVGIELLGCLERRNFPLSELRLFASARSVGKTLPFRGQQLPVRELTEQGLEGVNIGLFSAGSSTSKRFAPVAVSKGAVVVDNSSAFRMDAGVPLKAPVAGIAMGLIKEGERFAVLTDILGDEDHLGDMDFKVAGTAEGVTALQMDIKIQGITEEIMEIALEQANTARNHILVEMNKVLAKSRDSVSENAPSMAMLKIDPDKIRDVIGKGGAVIRGITEQTGASVDIDDDGNVRIYGEDASSRDAAIDMVNAITAEAEVGRIYRGKVARIVDFGAFVTILPGKDGLVHISQISDERVESVEEYLTEGQEILVKCLDLDARGRIKLSMKEISDEEKQEMAAADAAE